MSFDEIRKTQRVGLFHGCSMHKPRCVFMSLCRGVLHTPYKRPIYGANDPNDRLSMRILVPCGAILWGVCHTPLPCYPKNRLRFGEAMGWEVENVARFYVPV